MEKPASRDPDRTRAALLEAAFREIYRHGYQAASLERILADTGLTKGALYHHFPGKQALGLAVIREAVAPRIARRHLPLPASGEDPVAALLGLLEALPHAADTPLATFGCPLHNLIQEMAPLDDGFRAALQDIQLAWQRNLAEALERGQANGRVRGDVDGEEVSLFLISALEGCIGTAKNLQSLETLRGCLAELGAYIRSLAP